jgi:FKBP12-rapamycin complex-associated protein
VSDSSGAPACLPRPSTLPPPGCWSLISLLHFPCAFPPRRHEGAAAAAPAGDGTGTGGNTTPTHAAAAAAAELRQGLPSPPRRDLTREQVLAAYGIQGDASEVLNERAVAVMERMSAKLTGRDFAPDGAPGGGESDSVPQQVQRLIQQATSHENLCQSYIGWCPFW